MDDQPALKPLHAESTLSQVKLSVFEKLSTDALTESLLPGQPHCLKTRQDGTILDGHHRLSILQARGVDIDALPREILASATETDIP